MLPEPSPPFVDLVQARAELGQLTVVHRDSVNFFAFDRGFRRVSTDVVAPVGVPPDVRPLSDDEKLGGVTTTITCFESLREVSGRPRASLFEDDERRLQAFVDSALDRPHQWRSEGAARRYCIVRAVGPILRSDSLTIEGTRRENLAGLVREVWTVVGDDPETRGIYEVALPPGGPEPAPAADAPPGDGTAVAAPGGSRPGVPAANRYPPNAFLTYWAMRAYPALGDEQFRGDYHHRFSLAESWLYGAVGREVALHFDGSTGRDPQQLAWAICGVLAARTTPLNERAEGTAELISAGLRAFFEQQLDDGTWERGRALFHYPEAGNAYCYVFETLAELLAVALDAHHAVAPELREALRPYLGRLLAAKDHLVRTARDLGPAGLRGWSSNHHPHRPAPESWATATAFRFLQLLRRLVGLEVRRQALGTLPSAIPRESLETLRRRGSTWDAGQGAAGDLLASLFVHPAKAFDAEHEELDPDRRLFGENRARSAILFGPPGTGKTTLVEAVAGAIGWSFVEITPADFLDQGMDRVSARADEIFKQLMELDRCVVLLDEIDELIRTRRSTADPLERFFTTTMLPRLARLWKLGRVMFFVNTNSISDVDPAVRRSQRFDAAIFVLPPSLDRKLLMLPEELRHHVDRGLIDKILDKYDTHPSEVSNEQARIGWFAFLRHDQVQRLAKTPLADKDAFLDQVTRLGRELVKSDWALSIEPPGEADPTAWSDLNDLQRVVRAYKLGRDFQRTDTGRLRLVRVADGGDVPDGVTNSGIAGYGRWDDAVTGWNLVPLNGAAELA